MDYIYLIDLIGTLVFAISGAMVAAENEMDVFGAFVLAFATAVGGGTLRDMMIGSHPVGWMNDLNYLYIIALGAFLAVFLKKYILKLTKTMFLFDSIGLGLFVILGLQKTLDYSISPVIGVLMGTVSASFGGVVRDVLVNRVPLIFRSEIYATACVAGGVLFLFLQHLGASRPVSMVLSIVFVIVLRVLAVRFHWKLPTLKL